jgi:hypothetical protein
MCDQLELTTPGEQTQALGHLFIWYQTWCSQPELDAGLWLRSPLNEIGSWAKVPQDMEMKWGRALLAAGYLESLKDVYPEPLGSVRKGYVALDAERGVMLDVIFKLLRRRANAQTLCLYLMDRRIRNKWSRVLRIDCAMLEEKGQIPKGWLDASSEDDDQMTSPVGRESPDRGSRAQGAGRVPKVGFQGTSPDTVAKDSNEEMLTAIRTYKYSDPLRACAAMDNSDLAMRQWRKAIAKDPEKVRQELGNISEDANRFHSLRKPAAVLTANLKRAGALPGGSYNNHES